MTIARGDHIRHIKFCVISIIGLPKSVSAPDQMTVAVAALILVDIQACLAPCPLQSWSAASMGIRASDGSDERGYKVYEGVYSIINVCAHPSIWFLPGMSRLVT